MDSNFPNYHSFGSYNPSSYLNSGEYPNSQPFYTSQFSPNLSQIPLFQHQPPQNISQHLSFDGASEVKAKKPAPINWGVKEDIALMSAYIFCSEDSVVGKNQKSASLWSRVSALYHEAQAEKPEEIHARNMPAIKGHYKRLNENAARWVGVYREALRRKRSGMSEVDVEVEAHALYEKKGGKKFTDLVIFNKVMCKSPKWQIEEGDRGSTYFPPQNEEEIESGGSSKRSKNTEEGDYSITSNSEDPITRSLTISRPMGRDAAKKRKGKSKASNDVAAE